MCQYPYDSIILLLRTEFVGRQAVTGQHRWRSTFLKETSPSTEHQMLPFGLLYLILNNNKCRAPVGPLGLKALWMLAGKHAAYIKTVDCTLSERAHCLLEVSHNTRYMWEKVKAQYWCLWIQEGFHDHQVNKLFTVHKAKFTKRTLNASIDFTATYKTIFYLFMILYSPHCVWMTFSSRLTDCCDPYCWQRTRPNLSAAHHLMNEIISNYMPAIFYR